MKEQGFSKDDWHLCKGLLSVYLKWDDSKHIIQYQTGKIEKSQNSALVGLTRSQREQDRNFNAFLDLGSARETVIVTVSDQESRSMSA